MFVQTPCHKLELQENKIFVDLSSKIWITNVSLLEPVNPSGKLIILQKWALYKQEQRKVGRVV